MWRTGESQFLSLAYSPAPSPTQGEGQSGPMVPASESSLSSLEAAVCVLGVYSGPQFPHLCSEGT